MKVKKEKNAQIRGYQVAMNRLLSNKDVDDNTREIAALILAKIIEKAYYASNENERLIISGFFAQCCQEKVELDFLLKMPTSPTIVRHTGTAAAINPMHKSRNKRMGVARHIAHRAKKMGITYDALRQLILDGKEVEDTRVQ